jgi:hypothetical protein
VITCLALIKTAGFYVEIFGVTAFRTLEAVRPALFEQVLSALLFRPEIPLKFHKRHWLHLMPYYKAYELVG